MIWNCRCWCAGYESSHSSNPATFGRRGEVGAFADAQGLRLPLYLWCIPLWRGMRALREGRLDDCRQLDDGVQTIGEIQH